MSNDGNKHEKSLEAAEVRGPSLSRRALMKGVSLGALPAAGLLALPGMAGAQQSDTQSQNHFKWNEPIFPEVEPSFVMKLGHQAPPNVFVSGEHAQSVVVKNIVERSTNGDMRVEIYPSNQLGNARELLEQTRNGIIQATIQESAVGTVYAPIQVFSIPFVFPTHSVAWAVFDSGFAREFFGDMETQTGLGVIGVGENGGFRCFTNSERPVHTVEDLKGLKIRTQEHPGQIGMMQAMGIATTPIPWAELYTSLQTGVVDGQENAVPTMSMGKLQEVQSYLTMTNHIYGAHYFLVNGAWKQGLPDEYRQILLDAGRQAAVASRGLNRILEWELLAQVADSFEEIYVPSAAEREGFATAAQPAYLSWYHENVDPQEKWSQQLMAAVGTAEAEIWG